jgi:glutamate-1-semialdehyde 2,1-aminomutase
MLENGVYVAPSQFESLFISTAIDDNMANKIVEANLKSLKSIL